ncbi:MAG: TIGR02680 family protein [Oscillospiraceae bacterium]|nr:TIGR02680 family protein [Oscillospiraceae bacterium]
MNRWRMHKLGFVHFWLYDLQEFPITDGHILLRGANASGKSITTQSFIPFLLDGNKSPERLDAFGSRDRRMEFYLLGNSDREESTGYLYLEFKKEQVEEYLTIGVGLRAQKGKPQMDFWGFCINDGRRVGSDGIHLYETVGKEFIPLSKKKLRNLLDDPDNWAESQKDYKNLVNRKVFRFEQISQYDQLIQLLIKVRAPKLSREGFRPSAVKGILNDSLQVLSDDDLSAMVSTMERMNHLEDTLQDQRTALCDAQRIGNEYTRYNSYMLGSKARAYLNAQKQAQALKKQLEDTQTLQSESEALLAENVDKQRNAVTRLAEVRAQLETLSGSDLADKQTQLTAARQEVVAAEEHCAQTAGHLEKVVEQLRRDEVKSLALHTQNEDSQTALRRLQLGLNTEEQVLLLGQPHSRFVEQIRGTYLNDGEVAELQRCITQRKQQIRQAAERLQRVQQAQQQHDSAVEQLDAAAIECRNAEKTLRAAQIQEQDERDRLLENFARYAEANRVLTLDAAQKIDLRQRVSNYQSNADWGMIRDIVEKTYSDRLAGLTKQQVVAASKLESIGKQLESQRREYRRIEREQDPVPPRSDQIAATRRFLAMQGIPCTPFYQMVDFRPDLPQERRDCLEAQLRDAGILDALVAREDQYSCLKDVLDTYPDQFLVPADEVTEPLDELIPDCSEELRETVQRCLRGISRSDLTAQTALLPNGCFRNGILHGHSEPQERAGFIGVAAREANRARQLIGIQKEIDYWNEMQNQQQLFAQELEKNLVILSHEHDGLPSPEDLDQAIGMMTAASEAVRRASAQEEICLQQMQRAKQQSSQAEQAFRSAAEGLPYESDMDVYEEVADHAEEYLRLLSDLRIAWVQRDNVVQQIDDLMQRMEETRDEEARLKAQQRSNQQALQVARAREAELSDFLDRPENRELAAHIADLQKEERDKTAEERDASIQCGVLQNKMERYMQDLNLQTEKLRTATLYETDLEHYFEEDLELGLTRGRENCNLSECAQWAKKIIPLADCERSVVRMGESLNTNFAQHKNSLLRYNPRLDLSLEPSKYTTVPRERFLITMRLDGQEMSLYQFISRLQNKVEEVELLLQENDRRLFEDILSDTISHKLRYRIEESQKWTASMSALMTTLDTSMGLSFSLDWKPRRSEGSDELNTSELVQLLSKDCALLTPEDSSRVSGHFRARLQKLRENAQQAEQTVHYADMIREVLDYRKWYEFRLYYKRIGSDKKELTDKTFNTFSGGEKAMSIYLPQFVAVSAQYQKGGESCPWLLALDEAFAGVDDKNIGAMFELVHTLDFDYIMNSQALWGCYSCVTSLDIAEFYRPANAQSVTIIRYHWDGRVKMMAEGI